MDPELRAYLDGWRASFFVKKMSSDSDMKFEVVEQPEAHDSKVEESDPRFDLIARKSAESDRRFDQLMETLIRIEDRLGTRRHRLRLLP